MASQNKATGKKQKVTLKSVFEKYGIQLLQYIDKDALAKNDVTFCILDAKKVKVENSKFNIDEQWVLTIAVAVSDGTVKRYWLTFIENDIRNEMFTTLQETLQEVHAQGLQALHSCKLQAIPLSKYESAFYAIDFTDVQCDCNLDNE